MDEICKLEANGLEIVKLKSKMEPIGGIDHQKLHAALRDNFLNQAFVVAWLDDKVLTGSWQNQSFHFYGNGEFELKYMQRLRVFDSQQELHGWRTNGAWKGRLRTDGEGEDVEAVVAHQLLFGTKGERLSSQYAKIIEDRGTKLILPLKDIRFANDGSPNTRVFIKSHNYVKTNAVHQATYFDCRFVSFTDSQNELS